MAKFRSKKSSLFIQKSHHISLSLSFSDSLKNSLLYVSPILYQALDSAFFQAVNVVKKTEKVNFKNWSWIKNYIFIWENGQNEDRQKSRK